MLMLHDEIGETRIVVSAAAYFSTAMTDVVA